MALPPRYRGPACSEGEVNMGDHEILYVGKVTCRKCEQEVVGFLAGPPDFKVTDEVRAKCEERWRAYHEGECKGK